MVPHSQGGNAQESAELGVQASGSEKTDRLGWVSVASARWEWACFIASFDFLLLWYIVLYVSSLNGLYEP